MKGIDQNFSNTNIPEKKEKVKNIEIEFDGKKYQIECYYNDFEYPEKNKEESGILGYERTIVDEKILFNILNDVCKNKGIDLLLEGYSNLDFINENKLKNKNFDDVEKIANKLYIDILSKLSKGEYPKNCLNHQIGGYVHDKDKKEEYRNDFIKDKFFIQKIYDIDLIKKHFSNGGGDYKVFNHGLDGDERTKSNINVFEKASGKKVLNEWSQSVMGIGELNNFYDEIKRNMVFAATPNSGFNVSAGGFFKNFVNEEISFGFSVNDEFFHKYLIKALDIYTTQLKDLDGSKIIYKEGISNILLIHIFAQDFYKDYINSEFFPSLTIDSPLVTQEDKGFFEKARIELERIANEYKINLSEIYPDKEGGINTELINIELYGLVSRSIKSEKYKYKYGSARPKELRLPVFINHDEIPQLEWGHAKYAHLFTKKGLNFIEFKHADHLPQNKIE